MPQAHNTEASTTTGNVVQSDDGQRLTLRRPDDWHVHLRDGAVLETVAAYTARQFARAIVMPNLTPPVTTAAAAAAYRNRIRAAIPADVSFEPLMTAYLTDSTDAADLIAGRDAGVFCAAKLYPANATTNSALGVTDIEGLYPVFEQMQRAGMPLLIHGEVTADHIDIFDREAVFIEQVLTPLLRALPELKVVFEHITTADAVSFVESANANIAATITPHHLMINRNALLVGGMRPHLYCLPIAKREQHRLALRRAATSGNPRFFLGTDSAPHGIEDKEAACGCAGIFNAPVAMECYAQVFEEEGALTQLQAFASEHGPDFYGLPRNEERIVLQRASWAVEDQLTMADTVVVPFQGGTEIGWRFAGLAQ